MFIIHGQVYFKGNNVCGTRVGLMVCVLDSGSSGPGWGPDRGHCVGARHFTFTVPLSTQVYKWDAGENTGRNPAMLASHPGGSRNTPTRFMLQETGDKRRPDGPSGS